MRDGGSGSFGLSVVLALGAGIVFGAWTSEAWGFGLGIALGYLLAQRLHFGAQLDALRRRVADLEARPVERPATSAPAAPSPAPAAAPVPLASAGPPATPAAAAAPASTRAPSTQDVPDWAQAKPATTPALAPLPPPEPNVLERAVQFAIAWIKGGNPVARAGIVILFFGAAFLAKYAADHSMFPIELRLGAIGAGAIALLVVGWRLREPRALYAQILQGGGIAGLYLTIFAAARLYHLVPHGFALPLLIAIATAAALLAVAQEALSLAVVGFAGGFLAPILLSTGGGSHIALFSYYAILNLGVFTVAWFRAWRVLNLVGFVFTFSITGLWRATAYLPENLVSADFFLVLFFLMYVAISILFSLRQKPELRGYVSSSLVFGLPVVVFTIQASLFKNIEYGIALSALAFGAFYLALGYSIYRTRHANLGPLTEAFAALGVIFGSLAIPLAFDAQSTAAMWSIEGAGLVWIGTRLDRKLARAFGALLQLVAGLRYLAAYPHMLATTPILNAPCIGALSLAVGGALSARWLHRHASLAPYEKGADAGALRWATAWWLFGGIAELHRAWPALDYGAGLAYGGAAVLALAALRRRWSWEEPARIGVVLLPVLALGGALLARAAHPFIEWGGLGWPALFAGGYVLLFTLDRQPDAVTDPLRPWLHAGTAFALAFVGAWEADWQVDELVPGAWHTLPWAFAPAALLWLANRPAPRPGWPLARHRATYQQHASVPLALWLALWVLVMNLANDGDPVWIPYVPLLNPLDVASAIAVAAVATWIVSLGPGQRARLWPWPVRAFAAVAAGLVFIWLNAALIRALHYDVGTPLTLHGIRHSFLVQSSLSIFWSLLGLSVMMLSTRRHWRAGWIAGASLMGVVVAKLFAVDLEGTGTIARIASFLSVGLLMLLAGYLSPLPPETARKEPA